MESWNAFISLLNEMSPYLLLGFLFAGLLHVYVPRGIYMRYLSQNDFRSVHSQTIAAETLATFGETSDNPATVKVEGAELQIALSK